MKNSLYLLLVCSVLLSACSSSDNDAASADATVEPASDTTPTDGGGTEGGGVEEPLRDETSDPIEPAPGSTDDDPSGDTASEAPLASDSETSTESSTTSADVATTPVESTSPRPDPIEPIQPGTLTAGDYDDQLNPWLYQQYSNDYLQNVRPQTDIPRLDLSKRVAVVITGSDGKPYVGARLSILDSQGVALSRFVSPSSGITYLYEDLDGLGSEFTLKVDDRLGDVSTVQTITMDSMSEQRQIDIRLDTPSVATSQLDLQLVIDTTGSMGDELGYLQTELSSILNNVQNANPQISIRTGLVVYRDIGDQYVVRSYPFTDNLADMQSALNGETFDGGGDYPEAMDQALAEALTFDWRDQSTKVSLLVADAPPHIENVNATWASARAARSQQIHIVPLAASGVAADAEYLMRSMAALTNSRYLFLTDDSGFGSSHLEPQVDCYIVTRLDGLIERVVNQLISGERTEPSRDEVIRQVGNYDAGVCQPEQQ